MYSAFEDTTILASSSHPKKKTPQTGQRLRPPSELRVETSGNPVKSWDVFINWISQAFTVGHQSSI